LTPIDKDVLEYKLAHYGVHLVSKRDSWLMRLIARIPRFGPRFTIRFWTTLRFPFMEPRIYFPTSVSNPAASRYDVIMAHELVHVRQFAPWYGPLRLLLLYFFFPLPVFFSGRWIIERDAYLVDILQGRLTVDTVVNVLHESYLRPWPKARMRGWFTARAAQRGIAI